LITLATAIAALLFWLQILRRVTGSFKDNLLTLLFDINQLGPNCPLVRNSSPSVSLTLQHTPHFHAAKVRSVDMIVKRVKDWLAGSRQ
jgi:hypothetical protein